MTATTPPEHGQHDDLPLVPLDRDDAAMVREWTRCSSTVFLQGEVSEAELAVRLQRTRDHRITLARDGDQVVATFRTFDSRLALPGGRLLPVNAVSGVTVLPTHRRRRLLTRMMTQDMTRALAAGTTASILIASEAGIYGRFGYGQATQATTWTLRADRARFTDPATGSVRIVPPEVWVEAATAVYADSRSRAPGTIDRRPFWWQTVAQVDPDAPGHDPKRVLALHLDDDGRPDGAIAYTAKDEYPDRVSTGTLEIAHLVTSTDAAYAALWRFAAEVDFVTTVTAQDRSPGEALPQLLEDNRAARSSAVSDFLWIRVHDVPAALTARRYAVPGSLVLDVTDPMAQVAGRYRLDVAADGTSACERLPDAPAADGGRADVTLGVAELGSLLMGGAPGTSSVAALRAAGRLHADDHAAALTTALFSWSHPAWCGTWF